MLRDLSKFLRERREELRDKDKASYTMQAVASRVATTLPTFNWRQIESMEKGVTYMPPADVLQAVAKDYEVPYRTLLELSGYMPTEAELDEDIRYQAIKRTALEEYLRLRFGIKEKQDVDAIKMVLSLIQRSEGKVG